jgi:hypothetical protein
MKKCSKCAIEKEICDFYSGRPDCKECVKKRQNIHYQNDKEAINQRNKIYQQNNKEKIKIQRAAHYQENKEELRETQQEYNEDHKEEIQIKRKCYRETHKEEIKESNANYRQNNIEEIRKKDRERGATPERKAKRNLNFQNRRQNDINFQLRQDVANSVRAAIKRNGSSKNGSSIKKHLPYTIEELKAHIESFFEPWMSWDNQGKYDPDTWNDLDDSTKTWQLDHIIPHSTFHYTSMEDQAFKDCWALSNLRPLSAKQNLLDGTSRIRHK